MALLSLLGLFIASYAAYDTLYWMGLLFFAFGVLAIFNLIRIAYDEAEGKVKDRHNFVPHLLVLVALGSVVFHVLSPWWWTEIASNWGYIDDTIIITFWITGVVFVAIILFMAYCVARFYHQKGEKAAYEPENKKLEWWLTIGTGVGVAAMLAPGLFVWNDFVRVPKEATEIEVVARQWQWSYRLPGKDGRLGTSDVRKVSADNPMGLNPDDPKGQDDVVIAGDDLHLPLGKPVKVLLRSLDVLHDFYVPEFRAKMDMVPGMVTYFWFTPIRTGTFEVLCAELCGVGHYAMRGRVVVDDESSYQAWLQKQQTFVQLTGRAKQIGGRTGGLAANQEEPDPVKGESGR
jgi:cytochrome c oxidase subunit 2